MAGALVTGAAGGIGTAIAERLASDGWRVALADVDADGAARLAARLAGAVALPGDVTDEVAVESMVSDADERLGGIDLVVNNAGIELRASIAEHTVAAWDGVQAVNLDGAFLVSRAALAPLRRGRGALVNVASLAIVGSGGQIAYDVSKGALVGLTRSLAVELGADGVRVNAVCPGFVDTPLLDASGLRPIAERIARKLPLGEIGRAADVAATVAFLGSPEASYVTGQALFVDGGMVRR